MEFSSIPFNEESSRNGFLSQSCCVLYGMRTKSNDAPMSSSKPKWVTFCVCNRSPLFIFVFVKTMLIRNGKGGIDMRACEQSATTED